MTPLRPERQECLTEEDEEFCFHRLGELLFDDSAEPGNDSGSQGQSFKVAIASRHGWTVFAHGKSESQQYEERNVHLQLNAIAQSRLLQV